MSRDIVETYVVSFECNGGSEITPFRHTKIETLPIPTKKNYIFGGWYTNPDFIGEAISCPYELTTDITLYAKWLETYVVTFESNGGSEITSFRSRNLENLPTPTKNIYMFDGWYTKPDFSGEPISCPYELTTDITLYAKWLETYVVSFESNGESQFTSFRNTKIETLPTPIKTNYIFAGWYTKPDFSGKSISCPYELTTDITLYAKWLETYVVSFESNGGTEITSFRSRNLENLPTPTKLGYIFAGWYTDELMTNQIELPCLLSEDITFYANWNIIEYNVQYVLNGGTNSKNNPTSYTVEDNIILEDASYDSLQFVGWFLEENFKTKVEVLPPFELKDIVLYAKFALYEMVKIPGANFEMGKTEITQKFYESVMGENPSKFKNENRPVEKVSWYDAIYFCNKLSLIEGLTPVYAVDWNTDILTWNYTPHRGNSINLIITQDTTANGYRLPTDDEWQYAVKGGENYKYAGSSNINEVAWVSSFDNSLSSTQVVAKKKANAYGLYDMLGNVEEWNWDSINTGYRNVRGGSFKTDFNYEQGTAWNNYYAYYRMEEVGFRIVRSFSE